MGNEYFFKKAKEPSKIKAQIVSKYFDAWANIICNTIHKNKIKNSLVEEVIGYIDLYAGRGKYDDGTLSTPLLILDNASRNIAHCKMLKSVFNDAESEHINNLKEEAEKLECFNKLKFKPKFYNEDLSISSDKIVKILSQPKLPPLVLFADPWGYKGLSLDLFSKVLKHWGCEVIFFFNYNRINAALVNSVLFQNMKELFGNERAIELSRVLRKKKKPAEKEEAIMQAVKNAMQEIGGTFSLEFKFAKGRRTSHHIIFVTKNQKGFGLMKTIMAKESDRLEAHVNESVTRFGFNVNKQIHTNSQLSIFDNHALVANKLGGDLLKFFANRKIILKELYLEHHINNHYIESDYKNAIRYLEEQKLIITEPPADQRSIRRGIRTVSDNLQITFPEI